MSCKFIKYNIPLHAHLQYVCNIVAKNKMDTLKALGVDYAKYALLAITPNVQWAKRIIDGLGLIRLFF